MRVLITGSHGLIGSALVTALQERGDDVRRLVRSSRGGTNEFEWDPSAGRLDPAAVEGIDAAVHLAGEPIADKRWTEDQKRRIRDSRVLSGDLLARRLAEADPKPAVYVSGSAIGFYGNQGDRVLDEDSPAGTGFLAGMCQDWEAATKPAQEAGIRVVQARTGLVLSPYGGVLKKLLPLFRLGLGGRLGSGAFYQSWIAISDEVGALLHALDTVTVAGPVNLTAPNPVTNIEFTAALGGVVHRPTLLSAPKFGLGVAFGSELVAEMVTASQRVLPTRLQASGYQFRQPELEPTLRALAG